MSDVDLRTVEQRIKGGKVQAVVLELLGNSIHFPLANIILEMLLEGFSSYLIEVDFYAMLFACLVQAWWLGQRQYQNQPAPFMGNLIGPVIYSAIEWLMDGHAFWLAPHHQAYWFFALLVGCLQQLQLYLSAQYRLLVLLAEHLSRTSILLVMYAIFEWHENTSINSLEMFLEESSHQFVSLVILLLGFVVGFGYWLAQQYQDTLQATAAQLRIYSEWLLGRELLDRAVADHKVLSLSRKQRAVLFMDIRGFTAWSEQQTPEQVVEMLNSCFAAAEPILDRYKAIKVKHTGDEIMAVFTDAESAFWSGRALRLELEQILSPYGLSAGGGIHYGELVEGLIGGQKLRSYDIIGDTVNTAKRLCDGAKGGELLISEPVCHCVEPDRLFSQREIVMKGKKQPLTVFSI
jgi:class 3 adenylate cyclase